EERGIREVKGGFWRSGGGFSGAGEGKLGAGERAFEQDFAAETVELARPPAGAAAHCAGLLHQALLLDLAAEVLFVQRPAGQSFDRALQLTEREVGRHQLEYHRAGFDLRAPPP